MIHISTLLTRKSMYVKLKILRFSSFAWKSLFLHVDCNSYVSTYFVECIVDFVSLNPRKGLDITLTIIKTMSLV